ncbi:resuscitation-promoting factor [Streptomyces sp. NBC_01565]|uniref:ubiquitin-like domain-containing protein n=1 Tax=Streptomyces sp. NBC_01565 TaxID=2975881 RepID=UPI002259C263|nr:resuscitation-promoting factor [Streptomyces sp. NBC_01565]MCX4543182.1 ubiquitin-like domain-containing protein [Streptomyces sp. NBC_01565]
MSDSPLPGAWPAPDLGGPVAPAGEPEAGVPTPRRGTRRRKPPAPGTSRRGRTASPDADPEPGAGRRGRTPSLDPTPEPGTGRRGRAPALDVDPGPGTGRRGRAAAPDGGEEAPGAGTGRRRSPGAAPAGAPAGAGSGSGRRRIVPQALVVAFLAGGTTAFVAADKSVRLTVDGVPQTLHTFAGDVDELLAAEGLGVGPHDLVAPARGAALDDGDEIIVRYGRPLRLTLDGDHRQVWTTARTVEGALRQLGVRAEGAYLSAPRTAPVPRAGLTLSVRTERSVTFMADGRERTIRTNAATVQEALDQAGITLHDQDTTSVPPASFPRDGQTVTVLRITGTREVREERVPYETEKVKDPTLFAGTEVVEQAGRPGARRVTYGLRTVNGVRQKPRKIAEETVREPVTQRIKVGTKPLPTSVAGADGLDWAALAQCESGGRPAATDPSGTYGGLYQFDVHTWQSLGGTGRPQDAPGQEQTYRAKKLYVQRGATPWPHCGRRLYR